MNHLNFKFERTKVVKIPSRAHESDSGIDFYVPADVEPMLVSPKQSVLIPSGIKVILPPDTALLAVNRSSMAKEGWVVGACLIDPGYRGEIHLHLINTSRRVLEIKPDQKIVQFIPIPSYTVAIKEVQIEPLDLVTDRGDGKFGSSNGKV